MLALRGALLAAATAVALDEGCTSAVGGSEMESVEAERLNVATRRERASSMGVGVEMGCQLRALRTVICCGCTRQLVDLYEKTCALACECFESIGDQLLDQSLCIAGLLVHIL